MYRYKKYFLYRSQNIDIIFSHILNKRGFFMYHEEKREVVTIKYSPILGATIETISIDESEIFSQQDQKLENQKLNNRKKGKPEKLPLRMMNGRR